MANLDQSLHFNISTPRGAEPADGEPLALMGTNGAGGDPVRRSLRALDGAGETPCGSVRHGDSLRVLTLKETALLHREEMEPWHYSEAGVPRRSGVMLWACFSLGGRGPTLNIFGPSALKTP